MRTAWLLQGLGFLILLIAVYFLLRGNAEPQTEILESQIISNNEVPMQEDIIIRSPAFPEGNPIPSKYTCDGENISPPLSFDNIPDGTVSLSLIVEDPDVPTSIREDGMWNHWVVFNIPPNVWRIGEGAVPEGTAGISTSNTLTYAGPCPPDREHRYFFKVFALDTKLELPEGATKEEVLEAMKGHIVGEGTLMGVYERTH